MIPISTVRIDEEIEASVLEVLRSGMIAQGPKVAELEAVFAQISGVKHAVAVNNGTTALVAVLKMLDVPQNSTVITSPFTFVATLNAAVEAGFKVRFADVDEQTFNITADTIAAVNPAGVSTVMPVHLYGQCADMTSISAQAIQNGWAIVEDAAQAHGALWCGRMAGTLGHAAAFSFYPTKNLGALGDAGAVVTGDEMLGKRLRRLRQYGWRDRYVSEEMGVNSRLDELQAAFLRVKLQTLEENTTRRRALAAIYTQRLLVWTAISLVT